MALERSKIALQLAHAIAVAGAAGEQRRWFDGGPTIDGSADTVVFVTWEDDHAEMSRRLLDCPAYRMGGAAKLDDALGGRFLNIDAADHGPLWAANGVASHGGPTPFAREVREECREHNPQLLIVDALDSAYACSEIERAPVRAFLANWDAWGRRNDCTVLFLAHPPKNDQDPYSGSTAWRNGVRSLIILESIENDRAKLEVDKLNYAKRPEPLSLGNWKWWEVATFEAPDWAASIDPELRQIILAILAEEHPERVSRRSIQSMAKRKKEAIGDTLEQLLFTGQISRVEGKRGAHMYGLPDAMETAA